MLWCRWRLQWLSRIPSQKPNTAKAYIPLRRSEAAPQLLIARDPEDPVFLPHGCLAVGALCFPVAALHGIKLNEFEEASWSRSIPIRIEKA